MVLVEACIESIASALVAARAGAHRLELCADLDHGGITPSQGLIEACLAATSLPVFVMVRPRGGDFCYDRHELDVMRRDVVAARALGAHGIVTGVLTVEGTVDTTATRALVDAARPLPVTFHRAFDVARDPAAAFEHLLELGVDRLLTSGQADTALTGAGTIATLVSRGRGRLAVMAGGGVRAANAAEVVARTGVAEVHTGAWRYVAGAIADGSGAARIGRTASEAFGHRVADEAEIAGIVAAVGAH